MTVTELTAASPVQFLPGVGPDRGKRLRKLGVRTVRDLLFLFPRDHEHPAPEVAIPELKEGQPASVTGIITDAELASRSPTRCIFGAVVTNASGAVRMVFFNQAFRAETIQFDRRVTISGTPTMRGLRMEFVHPKVRFLQPGEPPDVGQILPVYPLTEGFRQSDLRSWTREALNRFGGDLVEVLPHELRCRIVRVIRDHGIDLPAAPPDGPLPDIGEAIAQIHFPDTDLTLSLARLRFVFQELFVMQLALAMRRRQLTTDLKAPPLTVSPGERTRIVDSFGFELTRDQLTAMAEIQRDLARQFPMNRLLQGDVGSGKTAVAIFAMMCAVAGGHQAVMMAPTEVLARQHFDTLQRITPDGGPRIGLLCGSLSAAERRRVLAEAKSGNVDVIVGTQALLHNIEFAKLGLCVIDEQHKFGVGQRTKLRSGDVDPHYLVMSATPIPRSIAMTLFGDVDLSTIREKPPGRSEVNTYLSRDEWKDRWWSFVGERLDEGRQAYVVAPRVSSSSGDRTKSEEHTEDESRAEDVASVQAVYAELSEGVFANRRVALLHGGMDAEQKRSVMNAFDVGDIDVLVSTTVIEVGIDVPNATVMAILGANRFGLAQLHQLRGRVSRGVHPGHVAVFCDGDSSPEDNERLKVFASTTDGFELAEADFRLRGPGDLLGREQSGLPPMRIADLAKDAELLAVARELAQEMVDEDPELRAEELRRLRQQVMQRYGDRLDISDVA